MDALNTSYLREFAACWGILAGSLLIASPVVFFKIKDHTDVEEDLKFSDETLKEVQAQDQAQAMALADMPAEIPAK
jgi:hypothetical protein